MGALLSWAAGLSSYMGKVHANTIELATAAPALEGTRTVHVTEFGSQRLRGMLRRRGELMGP